MEMITCAFSPLTFQTFQTLTPGHLADHERQTLTPGHLADHERQKAGREPAHQEVNKAMLKAEALKAVAGFDPSTGISLISTSLVGSSIECLFRGGNTFFKLLMLLTSNFPKHHMRYSITLYIPSRRCAL